MNFDLRRVQASRLRVFGAAMLCIACSVAACSSTKQIAGSSVSANPSTQPEVVDSTTLPPTSTATTGQVWTADQQGVIDAYLAARAAYSTSLEHPDPTNPQLPATNVDPMLTEVRNTNAQWLGFGQAGRFPDQSVARTEAVRVSVDGDSATLETCGVDDSIVYEPSTGKVLNGDVVTVRSTSMMKRVGGTWKLATRSELERWKGVAGCALDSH